MGALRHNIAGTLAGSASHTSISHIISCSWAWLLRSWGRRKVSYVDSQGAQFLQSFINDMVTAIFPTPTSSDGHILCPSPWDAGSDHLVPLPMSPGLLFNTQDVFKDDSMSNVIKATWAAIATGIGSGQAQLQLKSGSINMCQLGDLIVFLLAEVPILAGGAFFAMGMCLLRNFAMVLQAELPRIVPLQPQAKEVAALRGCCGRAFRLDPRRLFQASEDIADGKASGLGAWSRQNGTVDHDSAKVFVWAYGRRVFQTMDIPNRTRVLMSDMAKGSGESMNLYFSYSPVLNLGAWLPFQVTYLSHPAMQLGMSCRFYVEFMLGCMCFGDDRHRPSSNHIVSRHIVSTCPTAAMCLLH